MPWARFDTGFLRDHFAEVPERQRYGAIAVYQGLVLLSAELLLDGRIAKSVFDAVATESGVSERQEKGRLLPTIGDELVRNGLLARTTNGGFQIVCWREHHSSREDVQRERKLAAERQRKARGERQGDQLSLPSRPASRRDIARDGAPVSQRDLARAGAEAAAEQEQSTSVSPLGDRPANWPEDDLLNPAAAATDIGPTEAQIVRLVPVFPDADTSTIDVILPLASALPAREVLELAWRLRTRKRPGGVGLFVDLLRTAIRRRLREQAAHTADNGHPTFDTGSRIERLKRDDPHAYLHALAPTMSTEDVAGYLDRYVPDEDVRVELLDLAADLRKTTAH